MTAHDSSTFIPYLDRGLELRDDLCVRVLGHEAIVWSPTSTTPHYLNAGAELLRHLMHREVTGNDLVSDLQSAFDLLPEQAMATVGSTIATFDMHGLFKEELDPVYMGSPVGSEFLMRGGDA